MTTPPYKPSDDVIPMALEPIEGMRIPPMAKPGDEIHKRITAVWHSKDVENGIKQIVKLCAKPVLSHDKQREAKVSHAVREIIDAAVSEGMAQSAARLQAEIVTAVEQADRRGRLEEVADILKGFTNAYNRMDVNSKYIFEPLVTVMHSRVEQLTNPPNPNKKESEV